ncbi:hypothetical protein BGP80_11480 [Pseudomonas putida]|uniref:Uncharacterized protein n=1 Tax=Pseudomonas putida TaxID=303 RepID=A0A2S3WC95_PSEPU|nr:hypothetical protein BGP80_11480 [Pseudomonas putida]
MVYIYFSLAFHLLDLYGELADCSKIFLGLLVQSQGGGLLRLLLPVMIGWFAWSRNAIGCYWFSS